MKCQYNQYISFGSDNYQIHHTFLYTVLEASYVDLL